MICTPDNPKDYTIVCNEVARRRDLSVRAKGIYYELATLPPNWKLNQKELLKHSTEGREAFAKAFRELVTAGYIIRRPVFNERGKLNGQEYKVFWTSEIKASLPYPQETVSPENRIPEKPHVLSTNINKVLTKTNTEKRKLPGISQEDLQKTFNIFWIKYERKGNKKTAAGQWGVLTADERKNATGAINAYFVEKPDKKYRKDAERYLRDRIFSDVIERDDSKTYLPECGIDLKNFKILTQEISDKQEAETGGSNAR